MKKSILLLIALILLLPLTTEAAITFNGGSSQYIKVGSDLGQSGKTANMSISVWVYRAGTSDHGAFFKLGNATDSATGGDGIGIGIGANSAGGFEIPGDHFMGLYEGKRWIDPPFAVGLGWHYYTMVVDASGFPTLYYDGVSVFSDSSGAPGAIGSKGTSIAQIGGYTSASPTNRYYTGQLADVRFYNRALTAREVKTLYRGGNIVNGLVGWWPLWGNGGQEIDISGMRNTGTPINFTTRTGSSRTPPSISGLYW